MVTMVYSLMLTMLITKFPVHLTAFIEQYVTERVISA
jgi:hypothetical protein